MTPQCQTMQDELKAYLDRELPMLQRLAVRRHLAHCAACREEMRIMEQIGQQLQSEETPQSALNPALREKILTAIPGEKPASSPQPRPEYSGAPSFFQSWLFKSGAVVTAVLLFLVATPFIIFRGGGLSQGGSSSGMSATPSQMSSERATSSIPIEPKGVTNWDAVQKPATSKAPARLPAPHGAAGAPITGGPVAPGAERSALAKRRMESSPAYPGTTDTSNVPSSMRRVHQEARIAVEVVDPEEKSNIVIALVKSEEGFVANNTLSTGADGLKTASLSLKVPVKQFETVLSQIGKLGDVKAKNLSGEDITQQFSDTQQADNVMGNELAIKEAQLKAAMLKAEAAEKAKKPTPDTWQLRSEVRRLRIEAAQTRGRLELLKKMSDLATITVELREKQVTASEGGFVKQMSDTSRAAMDSFLLAARLPITLLIWILAYAPLWLPMLLVYRFYSRTYQKKTP